MVALGSGGSSVGLALGLALGGWRRAAWSRCGSPTGSSPTRRCSAGIEAGVRSLLALGGACRRPARWTIDGHWFGPGYGHPTPAGTAAAARAAGLGLASEPTYTAKALAAAFERLDARPPGRVPADALGRETRRRVLGASRVLLNTVRG